MEKYIVIRSHIGNKKYNVGDTRIARRSDVSHLIGPCLAVPGSEEAKAAIAGAKKKTAKPTAKAPKKAAKSGKKRRRGK